MTYTIPLSQLNKSSIPVVGGKGANLAEMTRIGLPVPSGFTITTDTCAKYYESGKRLPHGLMNEVHKNIAVLIDSLRYVKDQELQLWLAGQELTDPAGVLRHLVFQLEGGEGVEAQKLRPFNAQPHHFRDQRPVGGLAPLGPRLERLLAQVATVRERQERLDQRT